MTVVMIAVTIAVKARTGETTVIRDGMTIVVMTTDNVAVNSQRRVVLLTVAVIATSVRAAGMKSPLMQGGKVARPMALSREMAQLVPPRWVKTEVMRARSKIPQWPPGLKREKTVSFENVATF